MLLSWKEINHADYKNGYKKYKNLIYKNPKNLILYEEFWKLNFYDNFNLNCISKAIMIFLVFFSFASLHTKDD